MRISTSKSKVTDFCEPDIVRTKTVANGNKYEASYFESGSAVIKIMTSITNCIN